MTNDEMVELSKEFHKTEDLYQLKWLRDYLEARIRRYTRPEPWELIPCIGCENLPKKCSCIPF